MSDLSSLHQVKNACIQLLVELEQISKTPRGRAFDMGRVGEITVTMIDHLEVMAQATRHLPVAQAVSALNLVSLLGERFQARLADINERNVLRQQAMAMVNTSLNGQFA